MDDNPQLIFESLNSTGLDLSEGDKIRNFILMEMCIRDSILPDLTVYDVNQCIEVTAKKKNIRLFDEIGRAHV